jgi:2,3-dihydroxyphenylpropionate 1,2-dioxygenase
MTSAVALVAMSHSPLLGIATLPDGIDTELIAELDAARRFAIGFDPDVVVIFHPDHYNGFFYDVMPPFCIGTAASSVGDYRTTAGHLDVPAVLAADLARSVLDAGVDIAISHTMRVDHGATQPIETLFGAIDAVPVIPIFINSIAPPFGPIARVRALGAAVGRFAAGLDQPVLFVASGGLSHDPPVPQLDTADESVRVNLLGAGRNLTPDARAARQQRVIDGATAFARGQADIQPLAPSWDRELMRILASGDLGPLDTWTADEIAAVAGHSAHEVRTWIAAHAALGAVGPYTTQHSYYRAIPELIAGFGIACATLTTPG